MFNGCWKYIVLFGLVIVNGETLNDSENEATVPIYIAKCTEYQKICPHEATPFNIEGEVAVAKEFPHMALIGYQGHQGENKTNWVCSGSLISENFVLTAGHCCSSSRHRFPTHVRLGDFDFDTIEEDVDVREFNVAEVFLYPDFLGRSATNDIALLKIIRTVDFSQYIQPACLPHLNTEISNKVVATGWGNTLSTMQNRPSTLQKVPLNLVPFDVCKESYPPSLRFREGLVNQTQLCAGSNPGERDTCAGFAGGPLLNTGRKFSCLYEIVGITSFGNGCGNGVPGVYTRLTSYIEWIEGIVWPEETNLV